MSQLQQPEHETGLSLKNLMHVIYALFSVGMVSAVFSLAAIAAVVVAYYKRSEVAGTVYAAHFDWIIKTFWWGLLWFIVSWILTIVFIGWVTGLITLIWVYYRLAKGWLAHCDGKTPSADA